MAKRTRKTMFNDEYKTTNSCIIDTKCENNYYKLCQKERLFPISCLLLQFGSSVHNRLNICFQVHLRITIILGISYIASNKPMLKIQSVENSYIAS